MLGLIMRITLITCLLAVARAQLSRLGCPELCQSGISPQFWGKSCDCTSKEISDKATGPVEVAQSHAGKLEDKGIYYEPADAYLRRLSFINPPFYIINPTIKLKIEASEPKFIFKRKTSNGGDTKIKSRVTHTHSISKDNEESEEVERDESNNLYLDIQTSAESVNSAIKHVNNANELSEKHFSECISLHLLAHSQASDKRARKENNLLAQIKEKCNQPANIVQKSLEEIKKRWPKLQKILNENDLNGSNINKSTVKSKQNTTLKNIFESTEQSSENENLATENYSIFGHENANNEGYQQFYSDTQETTFTTTNKYNNDGETKFETAPKLHLTGIMYFHEKNSINSHNHDKSTVKTPLFSEQNLSYENDNSTLTTQSDSYENLIHGKENGNGLIEITVEKNEKGNLSPENKVEDVQNDDQIAKSFVIVTEAYNVKGLNHTISTESESMESLNTDLISTIATTKTAGPQIKDPLLNEVLVNKDIHAKHNNDEVIYWTTHNANISQEKVTLHNFVDENGNRSNKNNTTSGLNKIVYIRSTLPTNYVPQKKDNHVGGTTGLDEQIVPYQKLNVGTKETVIDLQPTVKSSSESDSKEYYILPINMLQNIDLKEKKVRDKGHITASNIYKYQNDSEIRNSPVTDVSKIITREFENDTVVSSVIGLENAQNEDFNFTSTFSTESSNNRKNVFNTKSKTLDDEEQNNSELVMNELIYGPKSHTHHNKSIGKGDNGKPNSRELINEGSSPSKSAILDDKDLKFEGIASTNSKPFNGKAPQNFELSDGKELLNEGHRPTKWEALDEEGASNGKDTKRVVPENYTTSKSETLNSKEKFEASASTKSELSDSVETELLDSEEIVSETNIPKKSKVHGKETISGKLFFFFDQVAVPAKFVQNGDGEVSIGIDGSTMCGKLNPKNKKLGLIQSLCNGLYNKNCTHKSSENNV